MPIKISRVSEATPCSACSGGAAADPLAAAAAGGSCPPPAPAAAAVCAASVDIEGLNLTFTPVYRCQFACQRLGCLCALREEGRGKQCLATQREGALEYALFVNVPPRGLARLMCI